MKNSLPYLLNLPPFMFNGLDIENYRFIKKTIFILKGKILSIIINNFNGNIFCLLINFFYWKDNKISFKNNLYFKNLDNNIIFYPNKRILRVVNNYSHHFSKILKSYCIDVLDLKDGDLVVDCGANVGEINIGLKENNIFVKYVGFEPDPIAYNCLKLNNPQSVDSLFNIGLSNEDKEGVLYLDGYGGNSSLLDFGSNQKISVKIKRLDSFDFQKKIKLLKIDAEGLEPEVLEGTQNILKNIEFITVDFSPERGTEQNSTIVETNSFLYSNNFELVKFSDYRMIGLFKNKEFNK